MPGIEVPEDGKFRIIASYPTISEKWFLLDCEFDTRESRDAEILRRHKHAHGYAAYREIDPK